MGSLYFGGLVIPSMVFPVAVSFSLQALQHFYYLYSIFDSIVIKGAHVKRRTPYLRAVIFPTFAGSCDPGVQSGTVHSFQRDPFHNSIGDITHSHCTYRTSWALARMPRLRVHQFRRGTISPRGMAVVPTPHLAGLSKPGRDLSLWMQAPIALHHDGSRRGLDKIWDSFQLGSLWR